MKIDRTRFLVLTGALSAAACVVVDHPAAPPPAPPPPPPAATAGTPAAAGQPATAPVVFSNGGKGGAPPAPVGHVVFKPAPGPTPAPTGSSSGGTTPPAPSACLDSSATTVPACTVSCGSNPFMAQRCAVYAANFDPKVAAAAVTCMNGLTGAAACDSGQAYNCGKTALSQSCPDNTVSQLCQIAATPCKVASNDCITMVSGLNSGGQDAIAQCVAKGCSAGLYSCIEGLSSATPASSSLKVH